MRNVGTRFIALGILVLAVIGFLITWPIAILMMIIAGGLLMTTSATMDDIRNRFSQRKKGRFSRKRKAAPKAAEPAGSGSKVDRRIDELDRRIKEL